MTTPPTQSDSHVCRERTHHNNQATIWSDECSECDRGPDQINSQKKIGEKCDDRDFPIAISPNTVRCPTPSRRVREDRQQPADPDRGDVLRVRLHRSDDSHKPGTLHACAVCDFLNKS